MLYNYILSFYYFYNNFIIRRLYIGIINFDIDGYVIMPFHVPTEYGGVGMFSLATYPLLDVEPANT
jgi:hypothetical protein